MRRVRWEHDRDQGQQQLKEIAPWVSKGISLESEAREGRASRFQLCINKIMMNYIARIERSTSMGAGIVIMGVLTIPCSPRGTISQVLL